MLLVVIPTVCPGFLLCVPGIVLALLPVIALGVLAAAAGLVVFAGAVAVGVPLLVGRALARRVRHALDARLPARRPRPLVLGSAAHRGAGRPSATP